MINLNNSSVAKRTNEFMKVIPIKKITISDQWQILRK